MHELGTAHKIEVPRNQLDIVPNNQQQKLYTVWEHDFYYQMALNRPADVHEKYWDQRYRIFDRFDQGATLDAESWYSITYQVVADYIAQLCAKTFAKTARSLQLVLDCFSGCGGSTIPLALLATTRVVALDICSVKLQHLRTNAKIYNALDSIDLVQGDVLGFLEGLADSARLAKLRERIRRHDHAASPCKGDREGDASAGAAEKAKASEPHGYRADLVVLSPPWGGPDYLALDTYDLRTMLSSGDCFDLAAQAACVAASVALTLPRNTCDAQLKTLATLLQLPYRIEDIFVHKKFKLKLVLFGYLAMY